MFRRGGEVGLSDGPGGSGVPVCAGVVLIGIGCTGLVSVVIGAGVGIGGGGVVGGGVVGVDGIDGGSGSGNDGMVVGGDDGMGRYRRRNRRFLVVSLPEPSVLTAYW